MRKTLRRQKSGYALGFILLALGLAALLVVLWKAWPAISLAADPLAVFWESLWAQDLASLWGLELKLGYLMVVGVAMSHVLVGNAGGWSDRSGSEQRVAFAR